MAYNNASSNEPKGMFVYRDEKKRYVYKAPYMKEGRYLTKSDIKTFSLFEMRLPGSILICVLLGYMMDNNYVIGAIAGIVTYVAFTLIMVFWYLPQLPVATGFKKPSGSSSLEASAKSAPYWRILVLIIAAAALGVITIYNCNKKGYTGFTLYGNYALAALAIVYSLYHVIVLFKKLSLKEDK